MADNPETLSRNREFREVLSIGYAFVVGSNYTLAASAFTYEDLADQQIEEIEGAGTELRLNRLEEIAIIKQRLLAVVAKAKELPPEAFLTPDAAIDVNTPV